MTARKMLLFLSATDFHARIWQSGELSSTTHFANDAGGKQQFAAFLQDNRMPAFLLTDLVEEDFRFEILPRLHFIERNALIRRRLEHCYPGTPFRKANTLSRRKDGKREESMLFSALTNPGLLKPWLDVMQAHGIVLTGIYSIPHICDRLMESPPPPCLLLLSWEKYAGLRQTYFNAGMLRFSRLTPVNSTATWCETATIELERTRQYLGNLSLLPPGAVLDVHIICHASDRSELETQLGNDPSLSCRYLNLHELGLAAGQRTECTGSDATPLFLHLLARSAPRNNYAVAEHMRLLRLSHVRHALLGISYATAAASLLLIAANLANGIKLGDENRAITMHAEQLMQQTRQVTHDAPGTSVPAAEMKAAVLLAQQINNHSPEPQEILEGLSEVMDSLPDIRINKLSWQNNATLPAGSGNTFVQTVTLDGELAEFAGNYRSALEYLERFRVLLLQRGYEVTAQSLPLDISPQGNISTNAIKENNRTARFTMQLSRKIVI